MKHVPIDSNAIRENPKKIIQMMKIPQSSVIVILLLLYSTL